MGGGGYNRRNLARAWTGVVQALRLRSGYAPDRSAVCAIEKPCPALRPFELPATR